MLAAHAQGRIKAVCVGGSWHVRAPDNQLINLNSQEGAEMVLGLWEYIDTLEHREIKKTRRRTRKKVVEVPRDEEMEEMG